MLGGNLALKKQERETERQRETNHIEKNYIFEEYFATTAR